MEYGYIKKEKERKEEEQKQKKSMPGKSSLEPPIPLPLTGEHPPGTTTKTSVVGSKEITTLARYHDDTEDIQGRASHES